MSTAPAPVSDMLVTVKSREAQRAMFADMRGDRPAAIRHFLAVAHLELVLADDYDNAGERDLARRCRISAASSFWRAGRIETARELFDSMIQADPASAGEIHEVVGDLQKH